MKKFTLYVGLNDKDTKMQEIGTLAAYKVAMNIINQFCDGGTISDAQGFYKHDDGTVVIENSLRIELLFVEMETVKSIINDIKTAFNQEAVILQTEAINSEMF